MCSQIHGGSHFFHCQHTHFANLSKVRKASYAMRPDSAARSGQPPASTAFTRRLSGRDVRELERLTAALRVAGAQSFERHGVVVHCAPQIQQPVQGRPPGVQAEPEGGANGAHGDPAHQQQPRTARQQRRHERGKEHARRCKEAKDRSSIEKNPPAQNSSTSSVEAAAACAASNITTASVEPALGAVEIPAGSVLPDGASAGEQQQIQQQQIQQQTGSGGGELSGPVEMEGVRAPKRTHQSPAAAAAVTSCSPSARPQAKRALSLNPPPSYPPLPIPPNLPEGHASGAASRKTGPTRWLSGPPRNTPEEGVWPHDAPAGDLRNQPPMSPKKIILDSRADKNSTPR